MPLSSNVFHADGEMASPKTVPDHHPSRESAPSVVPKFGRRVHADDLVHKPTDWSHGGSRTNLSKRFGYQAPPVPHATGRRTGYGEVLSSSASMKTSLADGARAPPSSDVPMASAAPAPSGSPSKRSNYLHNLTSEQLQQKGTARPESRVCSAHPRAFERAAGALSVAGRTTTYANHFQNRESATAIPGAVDAGSAAVSRPATAAADGSPSRPQRRPFVAHNRESGADREDLYGLHGMPRRMGPAKTSLVGDARAVDFPSSRKRTFAGASTRPW
eukprot:TRINITY_DN56063_c0_g1_i1.p1 TRINITY_DN56063_c0_g1~~TRINITY_DN56063_c0_g1_i1.p1  ORF type:complete len:274 (-),score=16.74 TRINITY_DN56063_c0_g1_i1:211-1032(-)